jgi:hypothetical protein
MNPNFSTLSFHGSMYVKLKIAEQSYDTSLLFPTTDHDFQMARRWWTFPLLLVSALAPSFSLADLAFENTAIVRTIELGGSLVHVSTTYAVKALEQGQSTYQIAISKDERAKTSWLEVKVKGRTTPLELSEDESRCVRSCVAQYVIFMSCSTEHLLSVSLPKALGVNGTLNLVLETVQTHATHPFPEQATQKEPQLLKYTTDLFTSSPYTTLVQRTKIKYALSITCCMSKDLILPRQVLGAKRHFLYYPTRRGQFRERWHSHQIWRDYYLWSLSRHSNGRRFHGKISTTRLSSLQL